jgi:mannose-1-phosphate guanylyltransferase
MSRPWCRRGGRNRAGDDRSRLPELAAVPFAEAPRKSLDYAVMEKTSCAAVVEGQFRWSDIGSWDAVYAVSNHERNANALYGPAIALNARDCLCAPKKGSQRLSASKILWW